MPVMSLRLRHQTEGYFKLDRPVSNFSARFGQFAVAELGMSLRLRQSQGFFQSRSSVPPQILSKIRSLRGR